MFFVFFVSEVGFVEFVGVRRVLVGRGYVFVVVVRGGFSGVRRVVLFGSVGFSFVSFRV